MKKIILLIILIFSALSFNYSYGDDIIQPKYAILVYMNGSDLESEKGEATKAINEMIKATGNKKFPGVFIVQTGGTKKWHLKELEGSGNQRLIIKDGKIAESIEIKSNSMGDTDTFKEFINFSLSIPADDYMLIFWNHGHGSIKGFGNDELYQNDSLTLPEISEALDNSIITKKFILIGFDTCLMSTIETANTLSSYGKYMLASQELENQGGWNYSNFSYLSNNTAIEDFAKNIINDYVAKEQQYSITLWNLEYVPILVNTINDVLLSWNKKYDILSEKMLYLRDEMLDFGGNINQKTFNYIYPDMVDLDDVFRSIPDIESEYKNKYKKAKKLSIIYHAGNGYEKKSSGINIYLPYGKTDLSEDMEIYNSLEFSKNYTKFINKYYELLSYKNKFELDNAPRFISYNKCRLEIDNESKLNNIYLSIFKPLKYQKYMSFGYISKNIINKDNIIENSPDNYWIYGLGNQMLYVIEIDNNTYITPMLLKRDNVESIVNIKFSLNPATIISIANIENDLTVSKTLNNIKEGDFLTPLYPVYKFNEFNKKFIKNLKAVSYEKGKTYKILFDNIIGLSYKPYKETYQIRFVFENMYKNKIYSLPCKYY